MARLEQTARNQKLALSSIGSKHIEQDVDMLCNESDVLPPPASPTPSSTFSVSRDSSSNSLSPISSVGSQSPSTPDSEIYDNVDDMDDTPDPFKLGIGKLTISPKLPYMGDNEFDLSIAQAWDDLDDDDADRPNSRANVQKFWDNMDANAAQSVSTQPQHDLNLDTHDSDNDTPTSVHSTYTHSSSGYISDEDSNIGAFHNTNHLDNHPHDTSTSLSDSINHAFKSRSFPSLLEQQVPTPSPIPPPILLPAPIAATPAISIPPAYPHKVRGSSKAPRYSVVRTATSTHVTTGGKAPRGLTAAIVHQAVNKAQRASAAIRVSTPSPVRRNKRKAASPVSYVGMDEDVDAGAGADGDRVDDDVARIDPPKKIKRTHGKLCARAVEARTAISSNPIKYFYRNNAPGEEMVTGGWTTEEDELFHARLAKFGLNLPWALFAIGIPGRVGYSCSNRFKSLWLMGKVQHSGFSRAANCPANAIGDKFVRGSAGGLITQAPFTVAITDLVDSVTGVSMDDSMEPFMDANGDVHSKHHWSNDDFDADHELIPITASNCGKLALVMNNQPFQHKLFKK